MKVRQTVLLCAPTPCLYFQGAAGAVFVASFFLLVYVVESKLKMPEITPVSPRETEVGLGGSFQSANSVHQQGFIWYAMHPEQGMTPTCQLRSLIRVSQSCCCCGSLRCEIAFVLIGTRVAPRQKLGKSLVVILSTVILSKRRKISAF